MPSVFQIKSFFSFYFKARTKYSVHSPLVSDFIKEVMDTSKDFYADYDLESLRTHLKKDAQLIETTDLGAGSMVYNSNRKTIAQIAKSSLSSKWQCKIMFNLVNYLKLHKILELGTSLGLSTLYLSKANGRAEIVTIEGDPKVAQVALKNFENLGANNIELVTGHFDEVLSEMDTTKQYDLIFVDGNHTEEATIKYFKILFDRLSSKGVMVFDDIYWSPGMLNAWENIKTTGRHDLSIDLYYFGMIFKNAGLQQKQDFKILPYKWKPFDLGFFPKKQ